MKPLVRRWLLLLGVFAIAVVLAFPLREALYESLVVPVAYLGWSLGLFYRSLSQAIWWGGVILLVLVMLVLSLLPQATFRRRAQVRVRPLVGPVEALALSLQKSERSTYFKWVIANRLGKLAYQILLQRESGRPRSALAPLRGTDWEPSQELQTYLETGLHGSFADFPNVRRPFGRPPSTPLDHDIREAVEFLEWQAEGRSAPRNHGNAETS